MDTDAKIAIIFCVVFFFLFIGVVIYCVYVSTHNIESGSCPHTTGDFGVQVNKSGLVLEICGTTKTEQCTFNNITSLSDAINVCNAVSGCEAFEYSSYDNMMNIIDKNSKIITSDTYDLYVRQNPIIIIT